MQQLAQNLGTNPPPPLASAAGILTFGNVCSHPRSLTQSCCFSYEAKGHDQQPCLSPTLEARNCFLCLSFHLVNTRIHLSCKTLRCVQAGGTAMLYYSAYLFLKTQTYLICVLICVSCTAHRREAQPCSVTLCTSSRQLKRPGCTRTCGSGACSVLP